MAGGWNVGWDVQRATSLIPAATVAYVGSSSSGNAYGAWVTATASNPSDSTWLLICLSNPYNATQCVVDIGIGAAGSERVILSTLVCSNNSSYGAHVLIPVAIPAGLRIAVRCATVTASNSVVVQLITFEEGFGSAPVCGSQIDTYGVAAGSFIGTTIDPGGTAKTKGAWTQLTLAGGTVGDIGGLFLTFDTGSRQNGGSNINCSVDVGVGAAGSEQIVLPDLGLALQSNSISLASPNITPFIPLEIPAGSRLAVRASSDVTSAADQTFGVTIYGARQ